MTALEWSLAANFVGIVLLAFTMSQWDKWQAKYEEYRTTAMWMRDAANAQGKLEVSDRWNTYLQARLDLAAGLSGDVQDLLKDEEDEE